MRLSTYCRFVVLACIVTVFPSRARAMLTTSCDYTPSTSFMPSWGEAYISADGYSRYVEQTFYWHSYQRLDWFALNADSTFELDTWFYNYPTSSGTRTAYAMEPSGYWDTNLPSPYVDTQIYDGEDEKGVTIGSADAYDLVAGVYYYLTRVLPGPATTGIVKIMGQRGLRVPSGCLSTYCAFECNTADNNLLAVPFQSYFYAPGCRQWWWQWYTSINLACQYP